MGLGARNARQHDTEQMRRLAIVSEDYADFREGQRVMTVDGFPGRVEAVWDGPFPNTESYFVKLDNDMGGGEYRTADLRRMSGPHEATGLHTADQDYPELGTILYDRPDIATR